MKTSFVRDVRARDVRDIHPSIHRFVVRAGGPSVPSFARHRPHRSRERHRETNERTNRTNRIESNRIHDRPVPRFEIRDSRFERRASRVERRASRSPRPPPRAHPLASHPPHPTPPTHAHRPRVEIRDSHRRHHHSKSSFKIITHTTPRRIAHTPRAPHPTPTPHPRRARTTPPHPPHPTPRRACPVSFATTPTPTRIHRITPRARAQAHARGVRVDRWVGGSNGRVVTRASSLPRVLTGGVRDLSSVDESHTLVCVCVSGRGPPSVARVTIDVTRWMMIRFVKRSCVDARCREGTRGAGFLNPMTLYSEEACETREGGDDGKCDLVAWRRGGFSEDCFRRRGACGEKTSDSTASRESRDARRSIDRVRSVEAWRG